PSVPSGVYSVISIEFSVREYFEIGTSVSAFFFPKKKTEKGFWLSTALGIVSIFTENPGFLECIERCIWFAFSELSGAKAYAKIATKTQSAKKPKLKTPQKFFLNFWSAIWVNEVEFFTLQI